MSNTALALIELGRPEIGFVLELGRLRIGTGDDDDVFLDYAGVAPQHVEAIYLNQTLTILQAAGQLWVDGVAVTAFPCDVVPGQCLSLSEQVHLAMAVVGQALPLPPAQWRAPEALPVEAPEPVVVANPPSLWRYSKHLAIMLTSCLLAAGISHALLQSSQEMELALQSNEAPADPILVLDAQRWDGLVKGQFGQRVLGTSADLAHARWSIVLLGSQLSDQEQVASNALRRLVQKQSAQATVELRYIDVAQAHAQVQQLLAKLPQAKQLSTRIQGMKIEVSGMMWRAEEGDLAQQIDTVLQSYRPYVDWQKAWQLQEPLAISVLSVSVSTKNATATVRSQGRYLVAKENDVLFGVARLQLIRHDGIVIEQAGRQFFISIGK